MSKRQFFSEKSLNFLPFNLEDNKTFYDPFQVQPVGAKPIDFPEVQYALDKAELLVTEELNSKDSLDFLYNTLIDNPTIVIELQAHTDCRGGDEYNQKLSEKSRILCKLFNFQRYTFRENESCRIWRRNSKTRRVRM